MTDLVERLRTVFEDTAEVASWQDDSYNGRETVESLMGMHGALHEAADEIARLRDELDSARMDFDREVYVSNALLAENEKLRADAAELWMMLDSIDTGRSHKRRFEPRYEWVMMEIAKTCLFETHYEG